MPVRSIPLIAVSNVPATSDWYQQLLGCGSDMEADHPHRQEFDRIVDGAGQVLIGFHAWNADRKRRWTGTSPIQTIASLVMASSWASLWRTWTRSSSGRER